MTTVHSDFCARGAKRLRRNGFIDNSALGVDSCAAGITAGGIDTSDGGTTTTASPPRQQPEPGNKPFTSVTKELHMTGIIRFTASPSTTDIIAPSVGRQEVQTSETPSPRHENPAGRGHLRTLMAGVGALVVALTFMSV
ncbi:hypothetical protein ABIB25_005486 [Nakamurella sp. UYEF19]|uniref:hypothetical protein n=1 Tax=Nakamurella sp. UYEF19 TaxID=1756392 RepID=UPI003399DBED